MTVRLRVSLILTALFSITVSLSAQDITSEYYIGKKSVIRNIIKRGDAGFVICSGHVKNDRKQIPENIKIAYFDNKLIKKWEATEPAGDFEGNKFFITNEATEYIYWMGISNTKENHSRESTPNQNFNIYRYDMNGKVEKFEITIKEQSSEVKPLHIFSDADNLYYLSVKPAEMNGGKLKSPEELYLYTMPHNGKTFEMKKLNLGLKKHGQLGFIASTDTGFFLFQKRIDFNNNKMEIDVLNMTSDGELISTFTIVPKIKNFYFQTSFGSEVDWNGEHSEARYLSSVLKVNTYYITLFPNLLINIELDKKYNRFCVYGLTSNANDQNAKRTGPVQGIMLQTYSTNGEKISAASIDIAGLEVNTKLLNNRHIGGIVHLNFSILGENEFKFDFVEFRELYSSKTITHYTSKNSLLDSKQKQVHLIKKFAFMSNRCIMNDYSMDNIERCKYKLGMNISENYVDKYFFSYWESIKKINKRHVGYSTFNLGPKTILIKAEDKNRDTQIEFMQF